MNNFEDYLTVDIDDLWEDGFRGYEVYTYNKEDVVGVFGADEVSKAGTVRGWDIEYVFSTPELLKDMPFFDVIIIQIALDECEIVWEGK